MRILLAQLGTARQTPVLEVDGIRLPESNAILWYPAEGSRHLPADRLRRASVVRRLLFEQTQLGPLAELRVRHKAGLAEPGNPIAARLESAGRRALAALERHLRTRVFVVGDHYTIADLANYAYAHVEAQPGFVNDLAPLPNDPIGRGLSIYD